MRAHTVRDLGALVRSARLRKGLTQADLAASVGVSRDWIVRLEKGHPRLEAQLVLDVLAAVGLAVDVTMPDDDPTSGDVFSGVLDRLREHDSHG